MKSITLLLLSLIAGAASAASTPNIIHFLADDLGYNELGCYGQTKIKTPNFDQLAADGVRFTQFYSGHAVCAPSRCAFLTGKHTGHSFVRENLRGKTRRPKNASSKRTATGRSSLFQTRK